MANAAANLLIALGCDLNHREDDGGIRAPSPLLLVPPYGGAVW